MKDPVYDLDTAFKLPDRFWIAWCMAFDLSLFPELAKLHFSGTFSVFLLVIHLLKAIVYERYFYVCPYCGS